MTNLCNVYVQRTELSCVKYIERKLSNFLESNETRIRNKYCQSVFHINNSTLHQWFPCQLFNTLYLAIFFFNRYILIRMKKFQDFIVYLSVNKESISLSICHNYVSWFTIYTNKSSNIVCRLMLELFSIGIMFRRSLFKFARITAETHFSGKTMCYGQILAELCTDVSHSYW